MHLKKITKCTDQETEETSELLPSKQMPKQYLKL